MALGDISRASLLGLPGEIRNRICEYVLTAKQQLIFAPTFQKEEGYFKENNKIELHATSFDNYSDTSKEFNQIKYVSRQLYKETAGLEAKFNGLFLNGSRPAEIIWQFLSTCSPAKA